MGANSTTETRMEIILNAASKERIKGRKRMLIIIQAEKPKEW